MLHAVTLALALSTGQLPPWMTGESHPEDVAISVVTFGPGEDLYEWWGHTALVVEDRRLNHGRLYNFGMFGAEDVVQFVKNFAKGRLEFWVADASIGGTFGFYRQLDRDVRIQELDLTPDQAMDVAKALGTHVLPEHRMYLYHHYNDNCSTRPRDIVDRAIGGQLLAATSVPGRMTIRQHAARYAWVMPPMAVLLDFMQNDELDGPTTQKREAFLPDELERQLQALQVTKPDGTKGPLVKKQWTWFKAKRAPTRETAPNSTPGTLLTGLLLGGLALVLGRGAAAGKKSARVLLGLEVMLWGLLPGILGTGLFIMALFTDHTVTYHNENLLFVNPLTLVLLVYGLAFARGRPVGVVRLRWLWTVLAAGGVLDVLCKVLPWFDQDNWNVLALALPVNVAMAAVFTWLARQPGTPKAEAPAVALPEQKAA